MDAFLVLEMAFKPARMDFGRATVVVGMCVSVERSTRRTAFKSTVPIASMIIVDKLPRYLISPRNCSLIPGCDMRKNPFCVPLERSAGIPGGIMATYVLAWRHGLAPPTAAELAGVALLIIAIAVLAWESQLEKRRKSVTAQTVEMGTAQ